MSRGYIDVRSMLAGSLAVTPAKSSAALSIDEAIAAVKFCRYRNTDVRTHERLTEALEHLYHAQRLVP